MNLRRTFPVTDPRPVGPEVQAIIDDDGSGQSTARRHVEHGDFDTTSLKPNTYRNAVHRDWIAHNVRWGWASRQIKKGIKVLEPGCGREGMLFECIKIESGIIPGLYVGVDLEKIKPDDYRKDKGASTYPWAHFYPQTNFVEDYGKIAAEHGSDFDLVISFEVYEHMNPRAGIKYLDACREMLADDGRLLFSTPVYNGKKAANHIREYTADEMQKIFEDRGFKIERRFGTFASYHDVKRGIREKFPEEGERIIEIYETCRELNGDALLAGMLAPLVPDHSRNNTWICTKA